MSPICHQLIQKAITNVDRKPCLEVHGVCITPPFIHFKHAFEGRTYRQNLTIRNVGKSKVVVKITKPTSLAFGIKEVKGHTLSPGLCLSKEVSHVFRHANVPYCILPIYIDGKCIDYEIFAEQSAPEISFEPKHLDFGLVDTHCTSALRIITIRNDGSQPAKFFIDTISPLGHKYMADPNKGNIQPKSAVNIHIKIASTSPGEICDNLWLDCHKTFAIPITAQIIKPLFEPIHELVTMSFPIVEFPPTYIGVTSSRTMYIRNYSANAAMFCVNGKTICQTSNLEKYRDLIENYNYFKVYPKDGVLESKEVKVFHFSFNPVKPKRNEKLKHFYFCVYHISRIKCRYLRESIYEEQLLSVEQEFHVAKPARSVKGICDRSRTVTTSGLSGSTSSSIRDETKASGKYIYLKLYLYATAEEPSVSVIPDEIRILDLTEGQREARILKFQNHSKKLPIIISYQKATYVDVDPPTFTIEANKSIEISVSIIPRKVGRHTAFLQFNLKYHDESLIKKELKVIGKVSVVLDVDVKCAKKLQLPQIGTNYRQNCVLSQDKRAKRMVVALRSDTAKRIKCALPIPRDSLWKASKIKSTSKDSHPCTQGVDSERVLTVFGKKMKIDTGTYYSSHVKKTARQLVAESKKSSDDYDLSDVTKLLCKNDHLPLAIKKKSEEQMYSEFIPLSPAELGNVTIDPIDVHTERIAVHSVYNFELTIKNSNTLPIKIYIKPEKANITFPKGNRQVILANNVASLPITYTSATSGYYTASLEVVVNDCSVFVVNIMADVSPIFVNLSTDAIEFTHENTHFVEISNPLNADTNFRWSIRCRNFSINPVEGVVKGNSQIACQVTYLANQEGPSHIDAELIVFDVVTHQVKLSIKNMIDKFRFVPQKLIFQDIPLNISVVQKVQLRNESVHPRVYSLVENEFLKYADVYPADGIVYGSSYTLIRVTLKVKAHIRFSTTLKYQVIGVGIVELPIEGNVIYPDILVSPQALKFQTIPASTFQTMKITVQNRSKALASIKFDMSMYSECKITETKYYWRTDPVNELMLKANSSQHLYFHFIPQAITSDQFCLPIILNDIISLSPSSSTSKNISHYQLYTDIPSCGRLLLPTTFITPIVRLYATAHKLKFPNVQVYLTYKIPPLPCKNEYNLKISNPQKTEETFCIRTDELAHPFYLTHASGNEVTFYEKSIVGILDPKEEVILNITFKPDVVGTFSMSFPIYLKSDMTTHPHNILYVEGVFKLPEITTSNLFTYNKPGPLLVSNTANVELHLTDHLENCKLWISQEVRGWTIEFIEETSKDPYRRTVLMVVKFVSEQVGLVVANHCVSCSCGARRTVTIAGCRENCFLTNYAQVHTFITNEEYNLNLKRAVSVSSVRDSISLESVPECTKSLKEIYEFGTFFTEYPFFPEKETTLKEFLQPVVELMEHWAHTQGFFGNYFCAIPRGFACVIFNRPVVIPPFIELLLNITENELEDYFDLRHPGDEYVERVKYVYELYAKALDFLQKIGALFVYVRPEMLLGYTPYTAFVKNFDYEDEGGIEISIANRREFYRLSKQYWLDVLLQTYKVLVLKRLFFTESGICRAPRLSSPHERYSSSIKQIALQKHLFSNRELLLLNWFEFHYNDVRQKFWLDNPYLEERKITFFGENMTDGFVYAAVVIAYCPFLVTHFQDMCKEPLLPEEILHNNAKVIQSWRILNFSMKFTVEEIAKPNSLKVLIIMTYLYQMLPNMYPWETLSISAGLSQHSRKALVVKNVNSFPIAYKMILYGKDSECFNVNKFYVIPAKSKCKIVVDYWAKFVRETFCTLILSGECSGYHYANSNVINLVGNPDISFVVTETATQGDLYSVTTQIVKVNSPYHCAAIYQIQFTDEQPSDINEVNSLPHGMLPNNVYRFHPAVYSVNFDSEGFGFMKVHLICLTSRVVPVWVFFRNAEVGDFAIKVITSSNEANVVREVLRVSVPKPDETDQLANEEFRTVNLQVPTRNKAVWETVADVFIKTLGENEEVWHTYAHTTVGIHILQNTLIYNKPFYPYGFCEPVQYRTKVAKDCRIKFPKYVDIEAECSLRMIDVPIQIPRTSKIPTSIDLELVSVDGFQQRHYRIVFTNDSD